MGKSQTKSVFTAQILEKMDNPILKKPYREYFDNNFDKSFNDLKESIKK